jgi:fido (protein-threonine AMPylation protein)
MYGHGQVISVKPTRTLGLTNGKYPSEFKYLLDDAKYWHENNTYPPDEIAVRFKHRLVSIHCFPNGNGRHSRLMADIIIEKIYKQPVFSWGAATFPAKAIPEQPTSKR